MKNVSFPLAAGLILALLTAPALAYVPTYADSAFTLEPGKVKLFLDLESASDDLGDASWLVATFTYGISDEVELWVHPHLWLDDGADQSGPGDATLGVKWHFAAQEEWEMAVSPYVTLPTGDEDKGMGTGELQLGINLLSSWAQKKSPWAFNINLDFFTNTVGGTNCNDYAVVFETRYDLGGKLILVGDLDCLNTGSRNDFYFLGGVDYAISENLALAAGVRLGLNEEAADSIILLGATISL